MKLKFLLITFLLLPLNLLAQQAASANYILVDYGLFNAHLEGDNEPASLSYIAELNTMGNLSEGRLSSSGYYQYPGFIGMEYGDAPLPVTLSSFTAAFNLGKTQLSWITQTETNNLGWNIYRSEEGDLSSSLQVNSELIAGAGTSTEPTAYNFADESKVSANQTIWYWLEALSFSGESMIYGPAVLTIPFNIEQFIPEVPIRYGLHQNYPNPFNPTTTISFILKNEITEKARLTIYNLRGQKVRNLTETIYLSDQFENSGFKYTVQWNSRDDSGKDMATGVYYYRLVLENGESFHRRMILLR